EKLHNPKVEEDFAIIDQFLESLSIKLGIELQNKELLVLKIYNARNFLVKSTILCKSSSTMHG
ncbi:MAG: hypothetical protein IJJ10_03535, partial [Bacillus sp. (in: Bacteria)]|nr:hypothetical protein [Bacillus sp. (in: firmicutes)]